MSKWAWVLAVAAIAAVANLALFMSARQHKGSAAVAPHRGVATKHTGAKPTPTEIVKSDGAPVPAVAQPAPLAASAASPGPESAETPEQRLFELEQRFEQDGLPDARAYQVGREVRVELQRALEGQGLLQAVDCKLKTCRATMSLADMNADRSLFQRILAAGEGPFASFAMRAERKIGSDGKVETILFFFL